MKKQISRRSESENEIGFIMVFLIYLFSCVLSLISFTTTTSLAVGLGFEQKFKPDSRVEQIRQPNSRLEQLEPEETESVTY